MDFPPIFRVNMGLGDCCTSLASNMQSSFNHSIRIAIMLAVTPLVTCCETACKLLNTMTLY